MMDHLMVNKYGKSCCSNLLEALDFITRAYVAGIDVIFRFGLVI